MTDEAAAALARAYDLDLHDDPGDLALYEALASKTGGPILELGCGTGRIAVPLAVRGHAVTGVDRDRAMIARAQRAWDAVSGASAGSLTLVEADMLHARLDSRLAGRFRLVILALNTLLMVGGGEAQRAALRAMAAHLEADGLAVVDVWLPGADDLALYDGRTVLEWERLDPESGGRVAKLASARHDPATATVTLTQWFDEWPPDGGPVTRHTRTDRLHLLGASELTAMAEGAGMRIDTLAGDHQMGPFGPGVERAVLVGALV